MNPGRDRFFIQLGRTFPHNSDTELCRVGNRLLTTAAAIAAMPTASQATIEQAIGTGDLYTLVETIGASIVIGYVRGCWRIALRDEDGQEYPVPIQ